MSRYRLTTTDGVDERRAQWARELPDVDTRGMGIIGRMRRITLQLRPGIEEIFARHGLDTGEFDVLGTLLRSGPPYCLRPTELYRSLMISSGGLTDRLNRLTKAGLIQRRAASEDGRSLLVILTAKGRQITECAFREDMAWEAAALTSLTETEQLHLEKLLRKLATAAEQQESVHAATRDY